MEAGQQLTDEQVLAAARRMLEAARAFDATQVELKLRANLHAVLRDEHGNIKDERHFHNLITTAGLTELAHATAGSALAAFDYVAIGTGTTAANVADTALETEVARAQGTKSNPTAPVLRVVRNFAAGTGTGAITESGLLNAASTGDLLCRQVFSVINKGASDSLEMTWEITLS